MNNLQKVYGKSYFYSGKSWGDGYADYDKFEHGRKHPWEFMVGRITKAKQKGKVLDIGCAFGTLLGKFPDSFERYGSDISEFAISRAKELHPELRFAIADISEKKPFNEKFDVIIAFDVLEHTLNLRSALCNISAMMRRDSVLFVAVPVASRMHHLLAFLGKSFLTTMDSHLTLTTAKAWRNIILPEHFEIVDDFPITWAGKKLPLLELFRVFELRKRS